VITGVVVVLVVVGVAQRESREPVSYAPARRPASGTVSAPPQPAAVPPAESTPPAGSASEADSTPAVAQVAIKAETAPPPPPSPVESPPPTDEPPERRYASTWVNVRAGRSGSAQVVQILKPGEPVSVDSLRLGWYRVLQEGHPLGYVDRSLVGTDPEPASP